MLKEIEIKGKYIIDDVKVVKEEIEYLSGKELDIPRIKMFIEEDVENKIFHFNEVFKIEEFATGYFAWLDSGYKTEKGDPIFISLVKYGDSYCGHFVGTSTYLSNGVCLRRHGKSSQTIKANIRKFNAAYSQAATRRMPQEENSTYLKRLGEISLMIENEEKKEESKVSKMETVDVITDEIFANLKFPNWKSKEGLKRYLKIIGFRLMQLVKEKRSEYYISNKIGAVVNSGLINKYGEDYMIYYRIYRNTNGEMFYRPETVITSKCFYHENGFEFMEGLPKPISFFDGEEFNPILEDFDLSGHNMNHIVNERNNRFPENWKNTTESQKVTAIKNALLFGIKMQQRDRSFVKTTYSTECEQVSWLFPLHLNSDFPEEPELVMVIRKVGEFYQIKTILPYDDEIKDRVTATCLYSNIW